MTASTVSSRVDSSTCPHCKGPRKAFIAAEEVTTYGFSPVCRTSESPSSLTIAPSRESMRDTVGESGRIVGLLALFL